MKTHFMVKPTMDKIIMAWIKMNELIMEKLTMAKINMYEIVMAKFIYIYNYGKTNYY
jgi:hypothetical protein